MDKTMQTKYLLSSYNKDKTATLWIELSNLDNISSYFWNNFIRGFLNIDLELYTSIQAHGFPETPDRIQDLVENLSLHMQAMQKNVIIFNNVHVIKNELVIQFIDDLFNASVQNLEIMVFGNSRAEENDEGLKAPWARIGDTLTFSFEDIADYYRVRQISLTAVQLKEVHYLTEGNPRAVEYLYDYFYNNSKYVNTCKLRIAIIQWADAAFFNELEDQLQKKLFYLSKLEDFDFNSAREITGIGERQLIQLIEGTPFIMQISQDKFRLTRLFYIMLSQKAGFMADEEINSFYVKSAQWYLSIGREDKALRHLEISGRYGVMLEVLLDESSSLCIKDLARLMGSALDCFSESFLNNNPDTVLLKAYKLALERKFKEAEAYLLELAETQVEAGYMGELYAALGIIGLKCWNPDFIDYYGHAAKALRGESKYKRFHKILLCQPPFISLFDGQGKQYNIVIHDLKECEADINLIAGDDFYSALLPLAVLSYESGNVDEADSYIQKFIQRYEGERESLFLCQALFLLMRIHLAQGRLQEIDQCLYQLQAQASLENTDVFEFVDMASAWYYLNVGMQEMMGSTYRDSPVLEGSVASEKAWLQIMYLLKTADLTEIFLAIDHGMESAGLCRDRIMTVRLTAMKAVAYYTANNMELGVHYFEQAYDLARPGNICMPFVELGYLIKPVLEHCMKLEQRHVPGDWLEMVKRKSESYGGNQFNFCRLHNPLYNPGFSPVDMLSYQDRIILDMICQGLTRNDIAEKQNISLNTLKRSIKRIYQKLGVTNRGDCVRIAAGISLENHISEPPDAEDMD